MLVRTNKIPLFVRNFLTKEKVKEIKRVREWITTYAKIAYKWKFY